MTKRDKAYFLSRLEREHPAIYRQQQRGNFDSANAAFIAAGLLSPRKPANALMRAWRKASRADRREFLLKVRSDIAGLRSERD